MEILVMKKIITLSCRFLVVN